MIRIVLRAEHLGQALDGSGFSAVVIIQGAYILDDIGHLVDCVVSALRSAAVAGNSVNIHADLHTASVSSVDAAVRGLCGDNEFRTDLVLVDDVLPAQTVTVLFHDGADDHDLVSLRDQVHLLHDLDSVYRRRSSALLVRSASAVDDILIFPAFIGIRSPVLTVSDTNRINMAVDGNDLLVISDVAVLAGPADHISETIDLDLVETDLFHLFLDAHDYVFLFAALTGM